MDPAADPADSDAQRILEGIRRGWLDPSDVVLALNRRAEGEAPLEALHRQGLLDSDREHDGETTSLWAGRQARKPAALFIIISLIRGLNRA